MMTILLGVSLFAVSVLAMAIGLLLRGRALHGGCRAACAAHGGCSRPHGADCRSGRVRGHE